MEYLQFHQIEL